jgi:hypothetical protein
MADKGKSKRKLSTLPLEKKYELIVEVEKGEKKKKELVQKFNIPPNMLSTISTKRDAIEEAYKGRTFQAKRKRLRLPTSETVDHALLRWFNTSCTITNWDW